MDLLAISFIAGFLTILAPCAFALLPVIIGGSVAEKNPWRPLVVVASLSISAIIFTLLLKATALAFELSPRFWEYFSGTLIILVSLTMLFPSLWEKLAFKLKLYKTEGLLEKSNQEEGLKSSVLLGASLGPVFTSCSPTYAVIIALIVPPGDGSGISADFYIGFVNLVIYVIGMAIPLLAVAYGGRAVAQKFKFAVNPSGWFKRGLGILLIIFGLMIFSGQYKQFEAYLIDQGFTGLSDFEQTLLPSDR